MPIAPPGPPLTDTALEQAWDLYLSDPPSNLYYYPGAIDTLLGQACNGAVSPEVGVRLLRDLLRTARGHGSLTELARALHVDTSILPTGPGTRPDDFLALVLISRERTRRTECPAPIKELLDTSPEYDIRTVRNWNELYDQIYHVGAPVVRPYIRPESVRQQLEREELEEAERVPEPPRVEISRAPAARPRIEVGFGTYGPASRTRVAETSVWWLGLPRDRRVAVLEGVLALPRAVAEAEAARGTFEHLPRGVRDSLASRFEEARNFAATVTEAEEEAPPTPPEIPVDSEEPSPPSPISEGIGPRKPTVEDLRPRYLDEFATYGLAVRLLQSDIAARSLRPVYIFAGPPGVGKTSLARAFVRSYFMAEGQRRGNPSLGDRESPLSTWGVVEFGSSDMKGEPSAFVLNRVIPALRSMGFEGGNLHRFVLLDDLEQLTAPAQSLLKSPLEQLRGRSSIVLTVNDLSKILPAIRSRAGDRLLRFAALTRADLRHAVLATIRRYGLDFPDPEAEAAKVAELADGDLRVALGALLTDAAGQAGS